MAVPIIGPFAGKKTQFNDIVHTYYLKGYDASKDDGSDCFNYDETFKALKSEAQKNGCDNNIEFDDAYYYISDLCERYRQTGKYTNESGASTACMTACSKLRDDVAGICKSDEKGWYCGSLGNGVVNWIFKIIRIIRYAMPPLLIILSILDFIKAIAQEDESKMKEATKHFVYRLIAVALLFIIPFILNFILRIFNIPGLSASNPFCAK